MTIRVPLVLYLHPMIFQILKSIYPLVNINKNYWKLPFIVDLPIKTWWFSIVMLVYQRVNGCIKYNNPESIWVPLICCFTKKNIQYISNAYNYWAISSYILLTLSHYKYGYNPYNYLDIIDKSIILISMNNHKWWYKTPTYNILQLLGYIH